MSEQRPHPRLLVLSTSEAAMALRRSPASTFGAVISIRGQRDGELDLSSIPRRLELRFDDIEPADESDPFASYRQRVRQRRAESVGLRLQPPRRDDAEAIIAFARELAQEEGVVLCHCQGGVSRSAAAAVICIAVWLGIDRELQAVEYVRSVRPSAMPHRGLVSFADVLLDRKGKLMAAVDQMVQ